MADPKIKKQEHDVAQFIENRKLKPVVPPGRNLANLGMMVPSAAAIIIPAARATALYLAANKVQTSLFEPQAPIPKSLNRNATRELMALQQVLSDANIEKTIEDGYVAIPRIYTDPTSSSAPSLAKLQLELQALNEETLPLELQGAVKNLTEKLGDCFPSGMEPVHRPEAQAPHRHTGLEPAPSDE